MKKTSKAALAVATLALIAIAVFMIMPDTSHMTKGSQDAGSNNGMPDNSKVKDPNTVIISNYEFGPQKISVKKGTKVTWINNDKDRHNVKPDQDSAEFKAGPLLSKDEEYSVVFNTVGTYNYHCSPHPYMKASVEVTE